MRVPFRLPSLTPGTIAAVYAFFGLLWVVSSDQLVLHLSSSGVLLTAFQSAKGAVFVVLSAGLIWVLVARRETELRESHGRLQIATQRLGVLQRVFRHNIRNDMNVVTGYIKMARSKAESPSVRRNLATANETAVEVLEISDKLEVLDRYGVRPVPDRSVDLSTELEAAVDRFRSGYPAAAVDVDVDEELEVKGDGSVAHVFDELLENAAEHFDGPISDLEVSVSTVEGRASARVVIEDNGPGVPEGELKALEAGEESDLIHLSSVGFWLVHWLSERIEADVHVETGPERGTSVILDFSAVSS